jgi:hypothetical protein
MAASASSAQPSPPALTIGQLEAGYPTYCKALRMLIRDGSSLGAIQRTVCWERLQMLHKAMPRQYRDPLIHYTMAKRALEADAAAAAASAS